jgi:hypothetical protein
LDEEEEKCFLSPLNDPTKEVTKKRGRKEFESRSEEKEENETNSFSDNQNPLKQRKINESDLGSNLGGRPRSKYSELGQKRKV